MGSAAGKVNNNLDENNAKKAFELESAKNNIEYAALPVPATIPLERRPPLTTPADVFASEEAKSKVVFAVEKYPPGESLRWDKIITLINKEIEPTDDNLDPLRIQLDVNQTREVCQMIYKSIAMAVSDGLVLLNAFMPVMYKKHTPERGARISQYERDELNLNDDMYAYGELSFDIFATIYEKVSRTYGSKRSGIFYDLGSGVGQLVYAAAIVGQFSKCVGIEVLGSLIDRAKKRKKRWQNFIAQEGMPGRIVNMDIHWEHGDLIEKRQWTEATFIVLHWTSFAKAKQKQIASILDKCAEGTLCITFTGPIPSTSYVVLLSDVCTVSWGQAEFFVHEKVTPASS